MSVYHLVVLLAPNRFMIFAHTNRVQNLTVIVLYSPHTARTTVFKIFIVTHAALMATPTAPSTSTSTSGQRSAASGLAPFYNLASSAAGPSVNTGHVARC